MKKSILFSAASLLLSYQTVTAQMPNYSQFESYEHRTVGKISIQLETLNPGEQFDQNAILTRLSTKMGDPFSQIAFDQDIKMLSNEYERVDPRIEVRQGEINVCIKLWEKPTIQSIKWFGNDKIKTKKLQRQLGIKPGCTFNREAFNKAFNKVQEFYVKKGFFEAELQYTILPDSERNEVQINVVICEGRSGRIQSLEFEGLTKEEENAIIKMIVTKRYNLFSSWVTGTGTYKEEALEHDKLVIVDYLQNQGYADAVVNLEVEESPKDNRIIIKVIADKGELYHFGDISFGGNHVFTSEEIEKALIIHPEEVYSPQKVRDTMQAMKHLLGSKGYIESNVSYKLKLHPIRALYDIHFDIEEGDQYRVGLVRVLGNVSTNTNVILRESLLYPGEVFDSRRLEATQRRLEAVGFFKCVNVYAIRSGDDKTLGPNYRDINIEVEETTTGSVSLFVGASTADSVFGGLDLTENNFNWRGLGTVWKNGPSSVRGNGEYFHVRLSYGAKQSNYIISWLDPYFNDTLWRVGFETGYQHSTLQSTDYDIDTINLSLYANYPINNFWTFGSKWRFRNADIDIDKDAGQEAQKQERNSGIVTGLGVSLAFDSTDNPFKPHRGLRSSAESELLYEHRRASNHKDFPFMKFSYLNAYYYPVWRLGTFKLRGEMRFIYPMGDGDFQRIPLSELYFLGGDNTVRGYKPYIIGPHYYETQDKNGEIINKQTDDPTGGLSSALASLEYNQQILPVLDVFAFWDGGAISQKQFDFGNFVMSYGGGIRLQVGGKVPLTIGIGIPINPEREDDVKKFFFSMGGQF